MRVFICYCLAALTVLPPGPVCGYSYEGAIDSSDEWDHFLVELGLDKDIKKLIKPILDLNGCCSREQMAQTCVRVMNDVNKKLKIKLNVDDGIANMVEFFKQHKLNFNQNHMKAFRKAVSQQSGRLGLDDEIDLYELAPGDWEKMSNKEALCLCKLFCAGILAATLNPYCVALSGGIATEAISTYLNSL